MKRAPLLALLLAACSQPAAPGADAGPSCTASSECPGGEICLSGTCSPCSSNDQCLGGKACIAGACAPCTAAGQCAAGQACLQGVCGQCTANPDCAAGQACVMGSCGPCGDRGDCAVGQACVSGACGPCTDKSQCGPGQICSSGVCGGCTDRSQCAAGQACVSGACGKCMDRTQCGAGQVCLSGACGPCTLTMQCAVGMVCLSGACTGCTANSQCPARQACISGSCAPCSNSSQCAAGQTCSDGSCWDPPTSCKDVLAMNGGAADGVYQVDPDGPGAGGKIDVWCDMTNDGGGWTLVANFLSPGDTNGVTGWTSPPAVGTSFSDPNVTFKMADADINRLRTQFFRANGKATACQAGPCTVNSKAYFDNACTYQSDALGAKCGQSYASTSKLTILSWDPEAGASDYGLASNPRVVSSQAGGHVTVGDPSGATATDARAGENPSVQVWAK